MSRITVRKPTETLTNTLTKQQKEHRKALEEALKENTLRPGEHQVVVVGEKEIIVINRK